MVRETADIAFKLSGSELVALLMEDAAIKHHYPYYNKVAKRAPKGFAIFSYQDRNNVMHIAINNSKVIKKPIVTLFSLRDARLYLERICQEFNLCPKFCHLQEGVPFCSHYTIKNCKGVCRDKESVVSYNFRVTEAINYMVSNSSDYVLKEKGRNENETAFVLVKNGTYLGYGFVENTFQITHQEQLEQHLIIQKDNNDIQRILRQATLNK